MKDDWPKDADDQLIIEPELEDSLMEQAIFGTRNVGWSLPRAMQDLAAVLTACYRSGFANYLHAISLGFGSAASELRRNVAYVMASRSLSIESQAIGLRLISIWGAAASGQETGRRSFSQMEKLFRRLLLCLSLLQLFYMSR